MRIPKYLLQSGVYQIRNTINNKLYIGSAKNLYNRATTHLSALNRNIHYNTKLQRSFNKYGKESFVFEILATCPKEYTVKLEQWFLDNLNPVFNILKVAESRLGHKHSKETISKRVESRKYYKHSEETKDKMSKSALGRKLSEETKKKLSEQSKKQVWSEERRKVMMVKNIGSNNPRSSLTEDQVRNIKIDLFINEMDFKDVIKKYNSTKSIIAKIKANERWKHVNI